MRSPLASDGLGTGKRRAPLVQFPVEPPRSRSKSVGHMNKRVANFLVGQFLPAITCIGLAFTIGHLPLGKRLENGAQDQLTVLRAGSHPQPDERLIVAGIDDGSLDQFGRWPWSRKVHAQFMYSLARGKPGVVSWDILFTEPSDEDAMLVQGAKALESRVVFGAYTSDDDPKQRVPATDLTPPLTRIEGNAEDIPTSPFAYRPIPELREIAYTAYCDTPGNRRAVPLLQQVDGQVAPSLSLQSLMVYWGIKSDDVRVVLGDAIYLEGPEVRRRIPIDGRGFYYVNYRFGAEKANVLSYAQLLISYTNHYLRNAPQENLPPVENKIVLVGQYATGLTDMGFTPFGQETPLVLVHANIIDNILREDYARQTTEWPIYLGALLLGMVGMIFFEKRRLHQQALYALGIPALYLAVAAFLWMRASIALPLVWPVIGFGALQVVMIVRQLIREQRAKAHIKGMFGTYLSPELVNRMVESGESPQLGGHEESITAYFSDIESFSTFSEQLPPDRLVELMNEYLTACTDIMLAEGGSLDKYIGDAIVMMFGAPMPLPGHALHACVASQRVQLRVAELREKWKSEGDRWPPIVQQMQTRIGLNTGAVIVGNMGSRTRFNYTMMGDNVNLAARMESGAKSWGVYTMCTDATRDACVSEGGDRVFFRALGRIIVRGRTTSVPIFEIVGLKENVTEQTRECARLFEQGLECHYKRDWAGALELFNQSAALEPNQPGVTPGVRTNPSRVYIDIVRVYQIAPPPENWDGEYVMTSK